MLDADSVLRYRGRIDNGYAARLRQNARTTKHDLKQALEEVLDGKPVSEPVTRPVGCAIERIVAKVAAKNAPTYHRDVLPIMQEHCQELPPAGRSRARSR